ncbi:MAG TPA: hypothetical protein VLV86_13250 [Vicinamibacterales bacterium]|nr:hypothetical protein [Vicinamibacterales bacterium]
MKVAILILAILSPAVALADDGTGVAPDASVAASPQAPSRPVVGPAEPKRRGSMVGYIDDATIDTQIRIRFDGGFGAEVPDRAEFFYAQCGCNFAGAPGPGTPGANNLVTNLNFQEFNVDAQYALKNRAFHNRVAIFATAPVRSVQPQTFLGPAPHSFQDSWGFGDFRLGAKVALISDEDSTLTVQVQGYFPTGDAKKGLGTDHGTVEFSLLDRQKMSDQLQLELEVGDWHPTSGSTSPTGQKYSGDVFYYGFGPSYEVLNTGRLSFAPVVELVGWHVLGGQQQDSGVLGSAAGVNIVNLKVGARTTFYNHSSIYVGYGHALTDDVWYRNIVRLEYRYAF